MKNHLLSRNVCAFFKILNPTYIPKAPFVGCIRVIAWNDSSHTSKGSLILHFANAKKLMKNPNWIKSRELIIESYIYPIY